MSQEMRSLVHLEFESIIWGKSWYSSIYKAMSSSGIPQVNASVAFTIGFLNGQVEEKMMMKYAKYITRFVMSCSTT
jgi:hypothetical protein